LRSRGRDTATGGQAGGKETTNKKEKSSPPAGLKLGKKSKLEKVGTPPGAHSGQGKIQFTSCTRHGGGDGQSGCRQTCHLEQGRRIRPVLWGPTVCPKGKKKRKTGGKPRTAPKQFKGAAQEIRAVGKKRGSQTTPSAKRVLDDTHVEKRRPWGNLQEGGGVR